MRERDAVKSSGDDGRRQRPGARETTTTSFFFFAVPFPESYGPGPMLRRCAAGKQKKKKRNVNLKGRPGQPVMKSAMRRRRYKRRGEKNGNEIRLLRERERDLNSSSSAKKKKRRDRERVRSGDRKVHPLKRARSKLLLLLTAPRI